MAMRGWLGTGLVSLSLVTGARRADAAPPSADLMALLGARAAEFEKLRAHACYAFDGRLERLDGDGKTDQVKEMRGQVEADGTRMRFDVVKYTEDGEDKTDEAKKKAQSRNQESKEEKEKKEIKMPFLISEQSRYLFDQVAVDSTNPDRVRIAFSPKSPEENTIEGSAWVDSKSGTVLSAGFKLSKTSMFIDYVNVTVEFGAPTALGLAVSKITVEGKGGVLFFRRRFRGEATLSDYRLAP